MLCDYGCGQNSIKIFLNGKNCCSERFDGCPEIIRRRVATRKSTGPWHSNDTKNKISNTLEGRMLSNNWKEKISISGTGRIVNEEGRENIKKSKIGNKNPMFGLKSWNSGKTGKDDERILKYSISQSGVQCPNRSHPNKNKGKKKEESLEIISRQDPVYSNFRKYRNRISVRTRKTYEEFREEINPLNLLLGKCGIDGAHQIDHKISVRLGFEQGLSIEEISSKENLQILPWLENIKKYDGKGLRK